RPGERSLSALRGTAASAAHRWAHVGLLSGAPAARAMTGPRIFLLSPASCGGERARVLLREEASFPLAVELRERGTPLGEVFSFLIGIYFRGKLAYGRVFARPPADLPGVLVITPTRGLADPATRVTRDDLLEFAGVDVATGGERYRGPLVRDVASLAQA